MNAKESDSPGRLVVGLGEALFDCFEDRSLLGGAPVNFTVHAHRLLNSNGGQGVLVSRVGSDQLGHQLIAEVESRGMTADLIQIDRQHSTGRVDVHLSDDGQPTYEIGENVAWDCIEFNESVQRVATSCSAVCFGSLAQRSDASRATIRRFLEEASQAIRMFDVNLRQQYYSPDVLETSIRLASAVKLNEEELWIIGDLLDVLETGGTEIDEVVARLVEKYELDLLALTRGSQGTVLYQTGQRVEGTPVAAQMRADSDTVGAGDSCCAAIVTGMLQRWPLERTVKLANHIGAFVASEPGATPELPDAVLELAAGGDESSAG